MKRGIACIVIVTSIFIGFGCCTSGCSKKEDKLDVAAPPVNNAAPVPDSYPGKRRPPMPPAMGGGPKTK